MKSRKVKAATRSKAVARNHAAAQKKNQDLSSDDEYDKEFKLPDEASTDDDEPSGDELMLSEEEEVLPFDDEEEDSDDADIDPEEGLPSKDAWGKKKSAYYNADFIDEDRGKTYREEDAEKARAEAEEAIAIQKSVSSYADVNIAELFQYEASEDVTKEESDEEAKLDSLDQVQKTRFLKKKCPELLIYIEEFKEKLTEVKDRFAPLVSLVQQNKIPSEDFANYVKLKYQLLLHYCMNISFYLALRSKGPVHSSHPIFQQINSYKNMLDHINDVNENVNKEINTILKKLECNEEISFTTKKPSSDISPESNRLFKKLEAISKMKIPKENNKNKKSKTERLVTAIDQPSESDSEDEQMNEDLGVAGDELVQVPEGVVAGEKRTITYQIAKNKGLIAKRKKEHRNPRVHNRMKFRKAKIRRKGQVREVIKEVRRYEGEPTGISTHVVKSIKLK